MPAGADAANTQPSPKSDARHKHGDQNCELMVHVSIDRLKRQQQKDLERHQGETGCRHAEGRGSTGASLASGHIRQKDRQQQQNSKGAYDNASESDVRRRLEPVGVAQLELRAPEHNVEVIRDRREIAIDGRGGQRTQHVANLRHAIRHHAKRDEIFPHI